MWKKKRGVSHFLSRYLGYSFLPFIGLSLLCTHKQWSIISQQQCLFLIVWLFPPSFNIWWWIFFSLYFRWKTFEVKCNRYFQQFPRSLNLLLSGRKHWNPNEMSMVDEFQKDCSRKGGFGDARQQRDVLISPQEDVQIVLWTHRMDDSVCTGSQ